MMTTDDMRYTAFWILAGWAAVSVCWFTYAAISWAASLIRSIRQGGR